MKTDTTYRRIRNAGCGLNAHIQEDRIATSDAGSAPTATARIEEPMRRTNGRLETVSWDTAIQEIGTALRTVRSKHGPKGIGVYIGEAAQMDARSLVRALSFGVGTGTPHIFSESNLSHGPAIWITEQMLGHAATLMSDLSRAHYIVLLSGEQRDLGWGPFSPGEGHEDWIQHSRKTKKTKVVVVDPRKTELADTMDKYVAIRPGSESYLMLGMLTTIIHRGWTDAQFVRDYTNQFEELKALTADWKMEDFAERCGIDPAELSGIALTFSRSAMALVHPARQSFQNEAGLLGAWAWLALHAVTANILRPGGIFENKGVIDLFPLLTQLRTDKAPRTEQTDYPLLLMQAPATAFPQEAISGSLKALITVAGDPMGRLPSPSNTQTAMNALDLHIHIGSHENSSSDHADWVLPGTLFNEQNALSLQSNGEAAPTVDWSSPVSCASSGRPAQQILADLYTVLRPGIRRSVWGRHLSLLAQYVARTDIEEWEQKFLSDLLYETPDRWQVVVDETPRSQPDAVDGENNTARYLHIGDGDRSLWRPSTENKRVQLLPPSVATWVRNFSFEPVPPLVLRSGQWHPQSEEIPVKEGLPEVRLHPDLDFADGSQVTISTQYGQCDATVVLDDQLRPDVIDIPFYPGAPSLHLLGTTVDNTVGALISDGIAATISAT